MATLVERRPDRLPDDRSRHESITLVSPADGRAHRFDVYSPAHAVHGPLPLVLAPHPITWTSGEDYHGGLAGLKRGYHRGWRGLADAYGLIIASPEGHPRAVELCSLASPEQITDLAAVIDELPRRGYSVDRSRVYAAGLSMGALEALVVAGRYPDRLAAVCVFNPIVDLAAWYEDLATTSVAEIRAFRTAEKVALEVGGTPDAVPGAYRERSATTYAESIARVPTMLFWSEHDLIVPRQLDVHAYRLYRRVKDRSAVAPIAEYDHTVSHGVTDLTDEVRWQLHEWCDYELALRWLLIHRRAAA